MTFNIMTHNVKKHGTTTFSKMLLNIMTPTVKAPNITFNIMTLTVATLSIATFSIMLLNIKTPHNGTQLNDTHNGTLQYL